MKSLEELRARLDVIDRELLQLVAERQTLGKQIAEVKRSAGQPTRDFRREREVLLKARRDAEALGVSPALAESHPRRRRSDPGGYRRCQAANRCRQAVCCSG